MKRIAIFCGIVIGIMVFFLCYLGTVKNIDEYHAREEAECQLVTDYQCTEIKDSQSPIGIKKEYTWILKDVGKGDNSLAFYVVHQYVDVYLEDELVYRLMPSAENQIGKTVGSNWIILPLYPEDSGKQIRVEVAPVYESFRDRSIDFLIGPQLKIYLERLKADMPQLIVGVMAIGIGIGFIIVALPNILRRKSGFSLVSLGCFSMMTGLWRITDTRFTPFVMADRPVLLFYISIAMLMIGMIPLIGAIRNRFNKKSQRILDFCCLGSALVCFVQLILQITNVMDIRESLVVTHAMLGISVCVIIGNVAYDWYLCRETRKEPLGRKLSVVCVLGVLADTIAFYVKGNSSGLIFTLTAFLIYITINGIGMIMDFGKQEKRLREQEAELASSRVAIMLTQIQPHFLYNSLNTIYHLCEKRPADARKAISDFSDYLRGNLDSINQTSPVDFDTELRHVQVYLSLEKMRFDEELEVEYDIQATGFMIPALTVQPLVENAVKHGVGKAPDGGTVMIATREYKDRYEVVVSDNGVGYDPGEKSQDERSHVGIENVRNRLWKMSQATLVIRSEKGKGTTAVIRVPRE